MLFYVINLGYVKSSLLFSLFPRHFFLLRSLYCVFRSPISYQPSQSVYLFTFTYINMLYLGHMADKNNYLVIIFRRVY